MNLLRPCKSITQIAGYRELCTPYYGCPVGEDGRPLGTTVQGIVIHCIHTNPDTYHDIAVNGPMPPTVGDHTSVHYTITTDGEVTNLVSPDNLAWTHETCASNWPVPLTPPYSYPGWPILSAANANVPLDYYTISIGILIPDHVDSLSRCPEDECEGINYGLTELGYSALIKLLAELTTVYGILLDTEHVNFHSNIEPTTGEDCPCNTTCLTCDIADYCQECENYRDNSYSHESDLDNMGFVYGETLEGCKARICIDDFMNVWDGSSPNNTITITNDGAGSPDFGHMPDLDINISPSCTGQLVQSLPDGICVNISTSIGIIGDGTPGDPIRIDLCSFNVPAGTIDPTGYMGVDAAGCVVREALPAETVFTGNNTDGGIAVIAGGTSGHSPVFNLNIASAADCVGNLMTTGPSGICVQINTGGDITGDGTAGNPVTFSETLFNGTNTDGAISVTGGGTNGHGPTFDINIASAADCPANLISTTPSGLCVSVATGVGIIGDGTVGNPLDIDVCAGLNSLIIAGTPLQFVGFDATGCLVQGNVPAAPSETAWVGGNTDGTIVITAGGTAGHAPTIDTNLASGAGIQGDGTAGSPFEIDRCDLLALAPDQPIQWALGLAADNCLVRQDGDDFVRSKITGIDTNCLSTSFNAVTGEISVDPIISDTNVGFPAGCNGIFCTADGLWVAPEKEFICVDIPYVFNFGGGGGGPLNEGDTGQLIPETFMQVDNTNACYDLVIETTLYAFIEVSAGDGFPDGQVNMEGFFEWSNDGGATWVPFSIVHAESHPQIVSTTGTFGAVNQAASDIKRECVVVPAGGSVTLGIRADFTMWRSQPDAAFSAVARLSAVGGHV